MGNARRLAVLVMACLCAGAAPAQDKVFGWRPANLETLQLNPGQTHAGRTYRPGTDGGDIHVGIEAQQSVTVAVAWADEWANATQHPERLYQLDFRCVREHVVNIVYECHLPSARPMILLVRDERRKEGAILNGVGVVLGRGVDPKILPKIYNLLTPERDGQQLSIRIKAGQPMTVAVLPSAEADRLFEGPGAVNSVLSKTSCKQRGVEKLTFECTFNLADGPQAVVVMPDQQNPPRKKAEIELQTVKCVANCDLM